MFWKKRNKEKVKSFTCPKCGETHDKLAAIGFDEPHYYSILNEKDKKELAELTADFCTIRHADQTDRFIRTFLRMQINDTCEDLDYGVWVSVSEQTFNDYESEFENNPNGKTYFGMIANEIQDFEESTLGIHVNIETRADGSRPEIVPHKSEHQLIKEWEKGIKIEEAETRVDKLMNNIG